MRDNKLSSHQIEIDAVDVGEALLGSAMGDEHFNMLKRLRHQKFLLDCWNWTAYCATRIHCDASIFYLALKSLHVAVITFLKSQNLKTGEDEIFPVYTALSKLGMQAKFDHKQAKQIMALIETTEHFSIMIATKRDKFSAGFVGMNLLINSSAKKFFIEGVALDGGLSAEKYYFSTSPVVFDEIAAKNRHCAVGLVKFLSHAGHNLPYYSQWKSESYCAWRWRGFSLRKIGRLLAQFDVLNNDRSSSMEQKIAVILDAKVCLSAWLEERNKVARKGKLKKTSRAPAGVALWHRLSALQEKIE